MRHGVGLEAVLAQQLDGVAGGGEIGDGLPGPAHGRVVGLKHRALAGAGGALDDVDAAAGGQQPADGLPLAVIERPAGEALGHADRAHGPLVGRGGDDEILLALELAGRGHPPAVLLADDDALAGQLGDHLLVRDAAHSAQQGDADQLALGEHRVLLAAMADGEGDGLLRRHLRVRRRPCPGPGPGRRGRRRSTGRATPAGVAPATIPSASSPASWPRVRPCGRGR